MYLTNYSEDRILRTFLGTTVTAPTVYAALFISNPGETGQGTEISYSGYQRQLIAFSEPAVVTGGVSMANVADVAFEPSPISTNDITHVALMDAVVGGNAWAYMTLDESIQVAAGVAPLIQAQEWNYVTSGNFSSAYKVKYLNLLRGVSLAGFSPHMALWNGDPDTGGSELSGSGYARFAIAFSTPEVQASGQSMIKNTALVSSPRSLDNRGTMTHVAVMNAASGGEVVAFAPYEPNMIMGRGKAVFIRPDEYSVSMN